ncbi:UNVERIFIED_CONTAM: hypothetical protein RMT77_019542 [Armadillidium vulgare]
MFSVIFQSEYADENCSSKNCTGIVCENDCPNSFFRHPCLCCPICLPITQQTCSLNCTNVFCTLEECPASYKVPGICCQECL